MRNESSWKPSRLLKDAKSGKFSPNLAVVYPGSLHIAGLQLKAYQPLIEEHCKGDLLDCGCGNMPYYEMYRPHVKSVTGVDWEGTHGENLYADKIADLNDGLPFDDESFDSILVTDVIAHIYKPDRLFREFARVLRAGGTVLVTSPFFYWISEPPHEYFRYTEFAFRQFCEDANLKVIEITPYGGRMDVILDLLNKKMTGKISNRIFLLLASMLGSKKSVQKTGKKFPLGYSVVARKDIG